MTYLRIVITLAVSAPSAHPTPADGCKFNPLVLSEIQNAG